MAYGEGQNWRDAAAEALDNMHERAMKAEALLAELWADESVQAAVGEGDPKGLYARVEAVLGHSPLVDERTLVADDE